MNCPSTTPKSLHTIFGAGQVGRLVANELLSKGHLVRLVRRGPAGDARQGLTWMRGDVTDSSFADEACRGAAVVYNCASPTQYHRWHELLPTLFDAVREAATREQARLVVLDNLYMVGCPTQEPFDEDTAQEPCSRKGELRARLRRELFEAHERGDVRVTSGHASDYFGPDAANVSVFMPRLFERLRQGKPVELLGDPNMRHSYSYTPDVARGLATLGTHAAADGKAWHLPVAHQGTTAELVARFAEALDVEPRIRRVPTWVVRAGGLFVPLLRSVAEMVYQWESPFVVDDRRFCDAFGVAATPIDDAVRETARWVTESAAVRAAA